MDKIESRERKRGIMTESHRVTKGSSIGMRTEQSFDPQKNLSRAQSNWGERGQEDEKARPRSIPVKTRVLGVVGINSEEVKTRRGSQLRG